MHPESIIVQTAVYFVTRKTMILSAIKNNLTMQGTRFILNLIRCFNYRTVDFSLSGWYCLHAIHFVSNNGHYHGPMNR